MKMLRLLSLLSIILFAANAVSAQGIAITNDGSEPDSSAILELKATDKGFLPPRMNVVEMFSINNPATGLIVYCTTIGSFYYYDGALWQRIIAGADDDWTLSGNDMYANNTGLVSIGMTSYTPTHKLTIEDAGGTDVLRLIGPGSFGSLAKMNFGDGEYAYIQESMDDHLTIYGGSSLNLNTSYTLNASSLYGNIYLGAQSGGVGINLIDTPTADLDVDGTVRIRQGSPDPYRVLTSTDTAGTGAWQPLRTLEYPDGQLPMTPVTHSFTSTGYTVPAGKNLYITNFFNSISGGIILMVNGLRVAQGFHSSNIYPQIALPIIAGPGQAVTMNGTSAVSFNGFLVDATVTPVTSNIAITVPAGQTLVILGLCTTGGLKYLVIDGVNVAYLYGNYNTGSSANYHGLIQPVVVGSGSSVHFQGGTINGYYITQ